MMPVERPRVETGPRFPAAGRRRAAFTLIELLVGIVVLSGILGTAYLCLDAGLRSRNSVETRSDVLQNARVALALITADLRSAVPLSKEIEFLGMGRTVEKMEADNVDFGTHHWNPQGRGEGDFCEISYFVDRDRRTGGFALWRRRDPTPDFDPLEGGFRELIVTGLRGFKLEYNDGYEWFDTWGKQARRTQEETERTLLQTNLYGMPDAVRVTMALVPARQSAAGAEPDESTEPPLTFQTIVFLQLAERARTASYATWDSGDSGDSGDADDSEGKSETNEAGATPEGKADGYTRGRG